VRTLLPHHRLASQCKHIYITVPAVASGGGGGVKSRVYADTVSNCSRQRRGLVPRGGRSAAATRRLRRRRRLAATAPQRRQTQFMVGRRRWRCRRLLWIYCVVVVVVAVVAADCGSATRTKPRTWRPAVGRATGGGLRTAVWCETTLR
jgi:hypothetical protein